MIVVSDNIVLDVTFGSLLSFQDAQNVSNYQIQPGTDAVPVTIQEVGLKYTVIQSGVGFVGDYSDNMSAMVASSSMTAELSSTTPLEMEVQGESSFTAVPLATNVIEAGLSGESELSAYPEPIPIIEGASSFSATVNQDLAAESTMAASSSITDQGELYRADVFSGDSSFSATPTIAKEIQASLSGESGLVAAPEPSAVLEGDSSFQADLRHISTFSRKLTLVEASMPIQVGDFISLQSAANNIPFAQVVQVYSDGSVELDRDLMVLDPQNGAIPWIHTRGLEGVFLTTSKPTGGKDYTLEVEGLYDSSGAVYEDSQTYTAVADRPQVTQAEQLEDGQIIVTFSDDMRIDSVLLDSGEYGITGPSTVLVKTVQTVSSTEVMLTTAGIGSGSYELTVNATSTPYDAAGNPLSPVFNKAIFTGTPAITARSIFTDRGPITKPAESIQGGTTATVNSATQLTLPTAAILPSHVGLYITLTGTVINAGTFKITQRVSATVIKVVASFSIPDPASGSITWELFDPRNGEIADDPTDVTVRINGAPVAPDAVVGLMGQIVLSTVPDPTDTVDVDYCYICNPVVDLRRLNSKEFRLNNWNRDNNRPVDSTQHKYRYNNTLVQPDIFVPLDIRAGIDQPLQRDLKYRAYERAYSVALNDPNLLLLNSPVHKIAFPPMSRTLAEEFVNYQPITLPESDPTAPWERKGMGTASIVGTQLVVVDTTTGPFPSGHPMYWTRSIDLTYQHVFAIAWRMMVDAVLTAEGVFTGVAVGYADDEKATVVGFLDEGGVKKIGILKAGSGNDPSDISAWTGGLDASGSPTDAPTDQDWSVLSSYRIFRDRTGVITVYINGSITPVLQVTPDELPFLEELNDPFNELQGAFFGSLSREAQNTSTWNFVRYTSIPINPLQTAPSIYISYEATTPPEDASQPWTPVGFHGTETILSSDFLLLDSTSATDLPSSSAAGLISGDFKGYSRIEPLLEEAYDTVLDVNLALYTHTHGITPNAVLAAIDDGNRLIQLCFFPDRAAPKFSYGGRAFPEEFEPYLWNKTGGASATMVGQHLRIEDTTTTDGLVYHLDDSEPVSTDTRTVGHDTDYIFEFRTQVLSYTADIAGYTGVMASVYDSLRSVGVMFEEITGQRYVTFHSDGVPKVAGRFAFDWFDNEFHTYRAIKSTSGNLVSLFIDGVFTGSIDYSDFDVPPFSAVGVVSFGSATPLSVLARSTVLWAYSNFWRVWQASDNVKKFAGIWKGTDSDSLIGYHLPLRTTGRGAAVAGNTLTDPQADFIAAGVLVGEQLVVDDGSNKGVYTIAAVAPGADVTKLTTSTAFAVQPSEVDYRIVIETDWSAFHKYRIVKSSSGGVSVFLDSLVDPWIHADYSSLDLPRSINGIAWTVANRLPSVLWGAFDPTNISQTSWDYVRLGAVRFQSELGIVPHHQVLNQRNIMASYEHHRTTIPHTHTNFWSESQGIPPQTEPDFLRDPNLVAFTLLNDDTPLVPSTQTYEVRNPTPVLTSTVGLNRPEDVLNSQGFLLNEASQKIEIIVPDDVLYNCLKVIETSTGTPDLIAPFSDACNPRYDTLYFNDRVCLNYDGSVLPEDDPTAITPWSRVSDDPSHQFATAFAGILTYGTDIVGTRTTYRNNTPLPDAISLQTEVLFRLKVLQDSTGGLGDSQIRLGFSSPGVTVGLAFVTTPLGERYVLAVDLNNGKTVGGIPFDFYDGAYHDYRLVRDPGTASIQIYVDS